MSNTGRTTPNPLLDQLTQVRKQIEAEVDWITAKCDRIVQMYGYGRFQPNTPAQLTRDQQALLVLQKAHAVLNQLPTT